MECHLASSVIGSVSVSDYLSAFFTSCCILFFSIPLQDQFQIGMWGEWMGGGGGGLERERERERERENKGGGGGERRRERLPLAKYILCIEFLLIMTQPVRLDLVLTLTWCAWQ